MKKDIIRILKCNKCKSDLTKKSGFLRCSGCGSKYSILDKKVYFIDSKDIDDKDSINSAKRIAKKMHRLYGILTLIFSPVLRRQSLKTFVRRQVGLSGVNLNLGSGNSSISDAFINIDIGDYENVDIVADISKLPIKDGSVDSIVSVATLEHMPDPQGAISEMRRVLKKGGKVYCQFPFTQGFHASPDDYSRRTHEGLRFMFKDFECIELKMSAGPTSGFLWIFQEWVAIVMSFGLKPIYYIVYFMTMAITAPVKLLDYLLIYHPMAKNISSGFIFIGEKK